MNIDRTQAVETLTDIESLERDIGILKTAGGIKNLFRFRQLKKDLEPASFGVMVVEVNERDFLAARSRISKFSKK